MNFNFIVNEIDVKSHYTISTKKYEGDTSDQLVATDYGKKFDGAKTYSSKGDYTWRMTLELTDRKGKIWVDDSTDVNITIH